MDPLTVWAFCLATAWIAQRLFTDGVAKVQGKPLPSLEARARRQQLAQQNALTTGAPGVWQAFADRAANRIANPPPRPRWREELASYKDDVLSDLIIHFHARHNEKQTERAKARGEEPPEQSERLQHVLAILEAEVVDENLTGQRPCRHCVDNHAADGDELCPSCRAHEDSLAGQPLWYSPNSYPCRNRCGNINPYPNLACGTCMVAEHNATAAQPPPPPDSTPSTAPAGDPDRDTSVLGRCGHRLYSFESGPDCNGCIRDREARDRDATPGALYRCGAGCGIELVEEPGRYGPECAALDAEDYPADARRCGRCRRPLPTWAAGPDCTRCLMADHDGDHAADEDTADGGAIGDVAPGDDTPPYGMPAVIDGEVVPTQSPEPTTSPGSTTTTEGPTTTMSESTVINGDVHDPSHAHAHVTACATFVAEIGQQAEICANNMAAAGLGSRAVGEIRGMQDQDAAEFLGAADGAARVFAGHMNDQDNVADNEDLAGTVKDTYLAGDRRA